MFDWIFNTPLVVGVKNAFGDGALDINLILNRFYVINCVDMEYYLYLLRYFIKILIRRSRNYFIFNKWKMLKS